MNNLQVQRPRIVAEAAVSRLLSLDTSAVLEPRKRLLSDVPNVGTLQDGERYFLYRFLLYDDSFKKLTVLSESRSVNGIYLLLMDLSLSMSSSSPSFRVVTYFSDGLSMYAVMARINEDTVKIVTEGVLG